MKLRKAWRESLYAAPGLAGWITRRFHQLFYYERGRTWRNTRWLGTEVLKCPLDLWVIQEIVFELRPDWIVETGTAHGGSAHYLASLCDLVENGRVLSIDRAARAGRPEHPRLAYLEGDSTSEAIVAEVRARVAGAPVVLVLLDSDHARDHVLSELRAYADFVTPGSYCIVEDGNVGGHPVSREFGPGPQEAAQRFLAERQDFVVDREREKYFLTFNPGGYLRRTR